MHDWEILLDFIENFHPQYYLNHWTVPVSIYLESVLYKLLLLLLLLLLLQYTDHGSQEHDNAIPSK